jgi:WD40 repeat protein
MTSFRLFLTCAVALGVGPMVAELVRAAPAPSSASEDELPAGALARLGSVRFRHGGFITALAVSRDGKTIASASRDGAVRVWEADTGKLLRSIQGKSPYPVGVAFSPDGQQLLTNIDSEHLHVLDWASDSAPRALPALIPQAFVWSRDGKYIACAIADEDTVQLLDAASGKVVRSFKKASRAAFSADGKICAVGRLGGAIQLTSLTDEKDVRSLETAEASGNVADMHFSRDGRHVIAAHIPGAIAVWEIATAKRLYTLPLRGPVALVPGQDRFAAVEEGHVAVFDLKTGERKLRFATALDDAPFVFLPDGNRVAVGGPGNRVRIWNMTTGMEITFGSGHDAEVAAVAFTPDGKGLLSGGADGLRLWDTTTYRERAAARRSAPVQALSLSPTRRSFATSDRKAVDIWAPIDFTKEKPYAERPTLVIPTSAERAPLLVHSPDGARLVFADGDKKLAFADADARRGSLYAGLSLSADPLAAAFSPTGRHLAVQTRDGWLRHWMLTPRDGRDVKDLEIWTKRVQRGNRGAVAYSPDGLLVAVFSAGRVVLVDSVNGRQWYGFDRQFGEGDVQALAFSRDGRFVAAGHAGPAGFVRIWETLTGKVMATLHGHVGGVNAVAFAPDGGMMASAGADATILLWKLTLKPSPEEKPLTPAEAWEGLDSLDVKAGYRAMVVLEKQGQPSVALIEKGAEEAIKSQARIAALIRQLDDDDFRTRKTARIALDKEGLRALPALYEALTRKLPVDVERQIQLLIADMESRGVRVPESGLYGEALRNARGIHVLERIGGADAIRVLEKLAASKDSARTAADARNVLEYMRR